MASGLRKRCFIIRSVFNIILLIGGLWPLLSFGEDNHPLVARDVFSSEEIEEIKRTRNFFFFLNLDKETPVWMNGDRAYSRIFFKYRTTYFTQDDILHHVLTDSFTIRNRIEELYRGKMSIHTAIGEMLPSINIFFGPGSPPLTLSNAFANVYGFLMPANWLQIAAAQRLYKATKYILMRSVLDELLRSKLLYIRQHRLLQELEIYSYYIVHLQIMIEKYPQGHELFPPRVTLEAARMAVPLEEARIGFDDIALVMALEKASVYYSAATLNIADIPGFPRKVQPVEELDEIYRNKELFLEQVVRRSIELKAIKEFYNLSKLNIGIVATGGTLGNIDNPLAQPRFLFTFGYDTIPNILIANSFARSARIDVQREYINMLDNARRSHDSYVNSLKSYLETKRSTEVNRQVFKDIVRKSYEKDTVPDPSLLFSFGQMVESEIRYSRALHDSLQAKAVMDRFLLIDTDGALNYLPDQGQILEIFNDVRGSQDEAVRRDSFLDYQLQHVRKSSHLAGILYTPHRYPEFAGYSRQDIEFAVRRNIGGLLYSTFGFHKGRAFFRCLSKYLDENRIDLTQSESHTLQKKRASWWDRLFKRKQIFKGDQFELIDFSDFQVDHPAPPG